MTDSHLHLNRELHEGSRRRASTTMAVSITTGANWMLHRRVHEHLSITGHTTLSAYADQHPALSLARLAWLLGVDALSPADIAIVLLDEAIVAGRTKECAYSLLVRSLNDVPHRYTVSDTEARNITVRVLVAWWFALSRVVRSEAPERIVTALLAGHEIPLWRKPHRFHSRRVRRVFDTHWPSPPVVLSFEPLLATVELT